MSLTRFLLGTLSPNHIMANGDEILRINKATLKLEDILCQNFTMLVSCSMVEITLNCLSQKLEECLESFKDKPTRDSFTMVLQETFRAVPLSLPDPPPKQTQMPYYENDFLVIHAAADTDWVACCLLLQLEQYPGHRFRGCFPERDFKPGSSVLSNIAEKMNESKTILMVLSRDFLQTVFPGLGTSGLLSCLQLLSEDNVHVLNLDVREVPEELQNMPCTDCCKLPVNWNAVREALVSIPSPQIQHKPRVILQKPEETDTGNVQESVSLERLDGTEDFSSHFQQNYITLDCLGKGAFGIVFEAENRIDGCKYAVKRICVKERAGQREKVQREVKTLARLDHVGIVKFHTAWFEAPPAGWQENQDKQFEQLSLSQEEEYTTEPSDSIPLRRNMSRCIQPEAKTTGSSSSIVFMGSSERHDEEEQEDDEEEETSTSNQPLSADGTAVIPKMYLYIQMQLCRKDTLKHQLFEKTLSSESSVRLGVFRQIVSAVEYMHNKGLMHRDLKPSNIFTSLDGLTKIGDFGLATAVYCQQDSLEGGEDTSRHTALVGTKLYMSPEQDASEPYDHKVDIFALGLILLELFQPFDTESERINTLTRAKELNLPEDFKKLPKQYEVAIKLLSRDPAARPAAKDILQSEILRIYQETQ